MKTHWKNLLAVLSCTLLLIACPSDDKKSGSPAMNDDDADAGYAGDEDQDGESPDGGATKPGSGSAGAGSPGTKPDAGSTPDAATDGPTPAGDAGTDMLAASRFFLPTTAPDNTTTPRVQIDADGGMHMLYSAYAIKDAYYAYCPKGCTGVEDMKVARLETDGTAHGMLAVTADGKPRVLLSTLLHLYYGQCDDDCTDSAHWTITSIAELDGDRDVTGDAFALDPQGRPRFIMHTYLAYLGIGQKDPDTTFAQCDSNCTDAAQWRYDSIETEIWYGSQLKYDSTGRAHMLTGIVTSEPNQATYKLGAYLTCTSDCNTKDGWTGIGLSALFENDIEEVRPSFALALTEAGQPRVALLGKNDEGKRQLLYYECDDNCAQDNWHGTLLSDHEKLGSGVDLALDTQERPRLAFTLDHNIGMHYCEAEHCVADNSPWDLTRIELSGEVPPDNIILWPNCTVDLWFLHDPKLALTSDGAVRVGYQATDISGGVHVSDPSAPACVAGKDMVLSRMTMLDSYK